MKLPVLNDKNEKPLDTLSEDGGFCSIFRTIGCVGDSLSSGEFETVDKDGKHSYYDVFEYSWGQYIARRVGCKVYNFSRGGMTAKEYINSFAEASGFWDTDKKCQAYIIALGVNDLLNVKQEIGQLSDVDFTGKGNFNPTFAGYYGEIVLKLKKINPDAFFFFVTMPREHSDRVDSAEREEIKKAQCELLYELAEKAGNSYVIDLNKYAPKYDEEFCKNYYFNGHLNPCGYALTGKMIASYIDYIIRHDMEKFKEVGMMLVK